MLLIVYYIIFMIAGDLAAYFIGLTVEYEWGSQVSLIVFLALYFLFLWVSWLLAVWVTKPRVPTSVLEASDLSVEQARFPVLFARNVEPHRVGNENRRPLRPM